MIPGDEEDGAVNVVEWCELLDERLARFYRFVGKLKKEISIGSDREEPEARRKRRFGTTRKVQEKNGRRGEDRVNEDEYEKKRF